MTQLFDLLKRLSDESLEFTLSYTDQQLVRVSVAAWSEHWCIEFDAGGIKHIEVFKRQSNSLETALPSIEQLFGRVQRAWLEAANDLQVEMIGDYTFRDQKGERFEATVYLPEFGSPKGTLIFLSGASDSAIDAAHDSGFHVSFVSPESFDHYERVLFTETLRQFKWCHPSRPAPQWLTPM